MASLAQSQDPKVEVSQAYVFRECERLNSLLVAREVPDLVKIARQKNVRSIILTSLPVEAYIEAVSGGFQIYLSSERYRDLEMGDPEPILSKRERFTLAHEIIHTFFYACLNDAARTLTVPTLIRGAWTAQIENLCQLGANRLLLPERTLIDYFPVEGGGPSAAGIVMYSDHYKVSPQAAFIRLCSDAFQAMRPGRCLLYLSTRDRKVADWTVSHVLSGPGRLGDYHASIVRGARIGGQFYGEALDVEKALSESGQDVDYGDSRLRIGLCWTNHARTEGILDVQLT